MLDLLWSDVFEFPEYINQLYFPAETWLFLGAQRTLYHFPLIYTTSFDEGNAASQTGSQRLEDNNRFPKMITRFLSYVGNNFVLRTWNVHMGKILSTSSNIDKINEGCLCFFDTSYV